MLSAWLFLSASTSRAVSSLESMMLIPTATNNDPLSHNVGEPIGPAQTALEQAERDRTWW